MAGVAHIVGSKAVEKGNGAAVHAFPVNLCLSMFVAISVTNAHLLGTAVLAQEVLWLCLTLLGIIHLLLTVN